MSRNVLHIRFLVYFYSMNSIISLIDSTGNCGGGAVGESICFACRLGVWFQAATDLGRKNK